MSKNFLITGAARGIGRGLSRLLLSKGHRVFLLDSNEVELEHMRTQLPKWFPTRTTNNSNAISSEATRSSSKPTWELFQGDISSQSDIKRAVQSASTFFDGHLDVLINNAAATSNVLHDTKIDQDSFLDLWTKSLAVNLTGSMLMTRACLPLLSGAKRKSSNPHQQHVPAGGSVIFMSSTRAYQSELNSEAYASTKAGLLGLSQALSCSLAGDGVSCNAILPGWINVAHESKEGDEKGMKWEDGLTEEDHRWHFSGRVGKVEDILRAVEFLSETGSFITGQEIVVDGGVTRRMTYPE